MKPKLALGALLLLLAAGCATFSANIFKTEQAAATLADTAMKVWADYYQQARANPDPYGTTVAKLDSQRVLVDAASVKVGKSIQVVDKMRADYAAGIVDKTAVQSALSALSKNSEGIVALIKSFMPEPQRALVK